MTPTRIQLSRQRSWRIPANTVKVDRSTQFGNPFTVAGARSAGYLGSDLELARMCVAEFRGWLDGRVVNGDPQRRLALLADIEKLRGKNLACWCREGAVCHGDVLLELANKEMRT